MQSAIYLLGKRKEVSDIFNNQILPHLEQNRILVPDRTLVPLEKFDDGLLIALAGDNLEEILSAAILNAFEKTKQASESKTGSKPSEAEMHWQYTIGIVKDYYLDGKNPFRDKDAIKAWKSVYQRVGGPYSDETTASKLFVPIALGYLLPGAEQKARELEEYLTELASSTLASFGKK